MNFFLIVWISFQVLEDLLRKVLFKPDDLEISQYRPDTQHSGNPMHVGLAQRNVGTEWTEAMRLASKLLVEISTFLTSSVDLVNGAGMSEAELAGEIMRGFVNKFLD